MIRIGLFNSKNELVRTYQLPSFKAVIIYRQDTGRIELTNNTDSIEDAVPYKIIEKVNKSKLENGIVIEGVGKFKLINENDIALCDINYKIESDDLYRKSLMISGLSHIAVLLLVFLLAWILSPKEEIEKIVTVEIQKVIKKSPVKTVKMSDSKIKKRIIKKNVVRKKIKSKLNRTARNNSVKTRSKKAGAGSRASSQNVSQMGALGGLHAGKKSNLQLGSVSGNVKMGSSGKRGGFNRAVVGKGLVASSNGSGDVIGGAGKYVTRGKGGGNGGYGRSRFDAQGVGSIAPLVEESFVSSGLDRDQIEAVIRKNSGQMLYCYEKGLQQKSSLKGRVKMKFVINSRGRVSIANVAGSSLRSNTVETCMLGKLKNWKFPRPVGNVNVKVSYPFEFKKNRG